MILAAIASGFAAFFLMQAIRTPWRPEAPQTPQTKTYMNIDRRVQPWGRARYLFVAAANSAIGYWAW